MNPTKYGSIMLTALVAALWLQAETVTFQEGVGGYSGCEDTYFSRNRVTETQIYGPFGDSQDLIIQGGT